MRSSRDAPSRSRSGDRWERGDSDKSSRAQPSSWGASTDDDWGWGSEKKSKPSDSLVARSSDNRTLQSSDSVGAKYSSGQSSLERSMQQSGKRESPESVRSSRDAPSRTRSGDSWDRGDADYGKSSRAQPSSWGASDDDWGWGGEGKPASKASGKDVGREEFRRDARKNDGQPSVGRSDSSDSKYVNAARETSNKDSRKESNSNSGWGTGGDDWGWGSERRKFSDPAEREENSSDANGVSPSIKKKAYGGTKNSTEGQYEQSDWGTESPRKRKKSNKNSTKGKGNDDDEALLDIYRPLQSRRDPARSPLATGALLKGS